METLLNEATEQLLADLQELGVKAQVGEGRTRVEGVGRKLFSREAHSFIDVQDSPISWVNVVLSVTTAPSPDTFIGGVTWYDNHVRYAVPDVRITRRLRKVRISLVGQRPHRQLRAVTELQWKGEDLGTGLIAKLNCHHQIKAAVMADFDVTAPLYPFRLPTVPVRVSAHPAYALWLISTPWPPGSAYPLSAQLWHAYEAIAGELAATSRSV